MTTLRRLWGRWSTSRTTGSVPQVIYTVHPDGIGLTRLTATTGTASNHPSWAPDGRKLLFCYIPNGQRHGADLATINRDGSDMHVLAMTALTRTGLSGVQAPGAAERGHTAVATPRVPDTSFFSARRTP